MVSGAMVIDGTTWQVNAAWKRERPKILDWVLGHPHSPLLETGEMKRLHKRDLGDSKEENQKRDVCFKKGMVKYYAAIKNNAF